MNKVGRIDVGLLVLRIGVAKIYLFFGLQKAFGLFGGRGYGGQVDAFIAQGIHPVLAHGIILAELIGGTLLVLGFLTPAAAFLLVCVSAFGLYEHLSRPGGWDAIVATGSSSDASRALFSYILLAASLAVLVMGAGRISLDAKLFRAGKKKA